MVSISYKWYVDYRAPSRKIGHLSYLDQLYVKILLIIALSNPGPYLRGARPPLLPPNGGHRGENEKMKRTKQKMKERREKKRKLGVKSYFVSNIMCKRDIFLQIKEESIAQWNKLFGNLYFYPCLVIWYGLNIFFVFWMNHRTAKK